jgi:hypothetical protein
MDKGTDSAKKIASLCCMIDYEPRNIASGLKYTKIQIRLLFCMGVKLGL